MRSPIRSLRQVLRGRYRAWVEKHLCDRTVLEIQPVLYEGGQPKVAIRLIHECDETRMGEALLGPEAIEELVTALAKAGYSAANAATFEGLKK